jgi:hypothetical protein
VTARAFDGAALRVPENDDEARSGDVAGELHAAEDVLVQHVARDANAEDVA